MIDIFSAKEFTILDVTGKVSLDGTAEFDFVNHYAPPPNMDFAFLQAGSLTGDFTSLKFIGANCPTCTFNLSTLSLETGSTAPTATTPEPGTLILFGTGLLGMCYALGHAKRRLNA